ncbi:MAG: ABC transporter ATP-binding protein [Proteobacteria bacterium]|nr:ABC transporter ATP-binding protein [Pseudomonadota bacterium]
MKALQITDLKKSYGANVAIDNISFSIEKGEFFGFLGPNGAGKTSTINCITGIATHDSGTIEVFGVDVKKQYREARKLIGLAPQEFNIDFFAPVRKTLDYMGGYFGLRKRERDDRIDQLLHLMELEEHADKQFRHLSGGLKRRVMIARSLVHDPEFLILDEPTAGVDVHLRHELWRYLEEMNKEGKTILLTSHYIEEVEKLCGRIAIINKGRIVAEGDKADFISEGKSLEAKYLSITEGEGW